MKVVCKVIQKRMQQLRWLTGLSQREGYKSHAQQRLEEIIRLAHEGIERPEET